MYVMYKIYIYMIRGIYIHKMYNVYILSKYIMCTPCMPIKGVS